MGKSDDNLAFSNEAVDPKQLELQEKLGLNKRQLFTLDKSWKAIQRNLTATGVEMFIRLVTRMFCQSTALFI